MRVYSGTAKEGQRVLNTRRDRKEKLGRLYVRFADERRAVKQVSAGDIAAAVGLKFTSTGDTLAVVDKPIAYERLSFPEPVVSMAVEPRTIADRDRLLTALGRMSRDDPTFFTHFDEETGQQIIAGMGELHLEVRTHELEHVHHVTVKVGEPRVSYREGLSGQGVGSAVVDTPLGGQPQYAQLELQVEHFPNVEQGRVVFENDMPDGTLPAEAVAAVEQAAKDTASGGVLRGDPMINVRIRLLGATWREGESTPAAFAQATALAFGDAARAAGVVLLEPIMSFEIVCPEEFLGGVLRDLQVRSAEVGEVSVRDDRQVIAGRVPLARMFQYASILRGLTQGRGSCSLEPCEYGAVSRQDYARLVGE
jgi:elongation factor G